MHIEKRDLTLGTPESFNLSIELGFQPTTIRVNVPWPKLITLGHSCYRTCDAHLFYNPDPSDLRDFLGALSQKTPILIHGNYSGYVPDGFAPGTYFRFRVTLEGT
jgi:hypothetical protein